jgi:hypothetical protein
MRYLLCVFLLFLSRRFMGAAETFHEWITRLDPLDDSNV